MRSLRRHLFERLMVPLVAIVVLSAAISYALALYFANTAYDHWLHDSAHSLGSQVFSRDGAPAIELGAGTRTVIEWDARDRVVFAVRDANGTLLEGAQALGHPVPPEGVREPRYFETSLDGEILRGVAIRVRAPGAVRDVVVGVAETQRKRRALAREILAIVLVPELLLLACAALLIRSGVTGGLASLRRIGGDLERRGHRDLSPVSIDDVPEEIRPIVVRLNDLLARLGGALEYQRKFIADAAHQLRTPLAAVKLQSESLARMQVPERLAPHTAALGRAVDRAIRLSQQLLTLARAEPAYRPRDAFVALDLAATVQEAAAPWLPKLIDAGVMPELDAPAEPVMIQGDPTLIGELVANLIDNAIRYARGASVLRIAIEAKPHPAMVVEDNGVGIAPEAVARVFDRFFRAEPSGEGAGLGLAVVKEIAEAHGGTASLVTRPGFAGTRVRVDFG